MAQRSAIVFLTPGQLAGQMHTPRIHCKEHMHTEKTRFQHQIWPQKTGSISGPTICSLAYWGLVLGAADWSAKRASQRSFFSSFCPIIWGSIFGQHGGSCNDLCVPDWLHHQRVYLLKVSLRNHNHMRSTQLLRLQAYTHCIFIYHMGYDTILKLIKLCRKTEGNKASTYIN